MTISGLPSLASIKGRKLLRRTIGKRDEGAGAEKGVVNAKYQEFDHSSTVHRGSPLEAFERGFDRMLLEGLLLFLVLTPGLQKATFSLEDSAHLPSSARSRAYLIFLTTP